MWKYGTIKLWCLLFTIFNHLLTVPPLSQLRISRGISFAYARDLVIDDNDDTNNEKFIPNMFNFASHSAGAVIIDKAPSTAKGYSNLLNDDKDKYNICPCNEKRWVVIGLSEDILINSVAMANYEKYSSIEY